MEEIGFNEEVKDLLEFCGLPVSDIPGNDQIQLFGIKTNGALSAVVGIELFGKYALIRSLAVKRQFRKSGIGQELVASVENWARSKRVTRLFLLTETAAGFFGRRGYKSILRSEAPQVIKESSEFSDICPESSEFMFKELNANDEFNPHVGKAPTGQAWH